jgi:uncharacterized membrane protein YtjA (UPF0391 family)
MRVGTNGSVFLCKEIHSFSDTIVCNAVQLSCTRFSTKFFLLSLICHYSSKQFYRWHALCLNRVLSNLKISFMLRWTVIFLVIAIIAAIFGFGGIAAGAAGIAKVLFFIFLVLFILSLIAGRGRGIADDV